jgi:hypothetical protein
MKENVTTVNPQKKKLKNGTSVEGRKGKKGKK